MLSISKNFQTPMVFMTERTGKSLKLDATI